MCAKLGVSRANRESWQVWSSHQQLLNPLIGMLTDPFPPSKITQNMVVQQPRPAEGGAGNRKINVQIVRTILTCVIHQVLAICFTCVCTCSPFATWAKQSHWVTHILGLGRTLTCCATALIPPLSVRCCTTSWCSPTSTLWATASISGVYPA